VNEIREFMGVAGFCPPRLLGSTTGGSLGMTIPKLVMDVSEIAIIKMESIHAAKRYSSRFEESENSADFFVIKLNNGSFCYCLGSIELVPLPQPWTGFTGITPVVYCFEAAVLDVAKYRGLLEKILLERNKYMRSFWCGNEAEWQFINSNLVEAISSAESSVSEVSAPDWEYDCWFGIDLVSKFPDPNILASIVLRIICDEKIIVVSSNQSHRASAVLALMGMVESCLGIAYPHPCLSTAPIEIASELPNAPTPLIAGIGRYRRYQRMKGGSTGAESCLFVDIDNCDVYYLSRQAPESPPGVCGHDYVLMKDKVAYIQKQRKLQQEEVQERVEILESTRKIVSGVLDNIYQYILSVTADSKSFTDAKAALLASALTADTAVQVSLSTMKKTQAIEFMNSQTFQFFISSKSECPLWLFDSVGISGS
jgi:hypothetical protein